MPTRTQLWFRQHPVVTGLLTVPVALAVANLAHPVTDALDLPWGAGLVLLGVLLAAGFAVSQLLTGLLMGRADD